MIEVRQRVAEQVRSRCDSVGERGVSKAAVLNDSAKNSNVCLHCATVSVCGKFIANFCGRCLLSFIFYNSLYIN